MRRKDGKPKRRAQRSMPEYSHGFRSNPDTQHYLHANWKTGRTQESYSAVSLFAGCGGLDLGVSGGFEVLGRRYATLPIDVLSAIDCSDDAVATYKLNLGDHATSADLTTLPVGEIPPAHILMGGFPCQDFSSSGPKVGLRGRRGNLYKVLSEYMSVHRPSVVIGENVPHLERLQGGRYLETILKDFEAQGYRFDVWRLNAPDFGVPQSRRRLFLIGVRADLPGYPVRPQGPFVRRPTFIDEALADLESVTDETVPNQSQFFVATAATAGGGQGDHINKAGSVAYCIRANARGRIQFHYRLHRRLTVRECARLQTFPDQFVFPFSTQRNLTLIGNAVPPVLGYYVGKAVAAYLDTLRVKPNEATISTAAALTHERSQPQQYKLFASTSSDSEPAIGQDRRRRAAS